MSVEQEEINQLKAELAEAQAKAKAALDAICIGGEPSDLSGGSLQYHGEAADALRTAAIDLATLAARGRRSGVNKEPEEISYIIKPQTKSYSLKKSDS